MSNIRSRSRRTTLWTGKEDATPLQSFIDKCNRDSFERRHPGITETGEAELVNSFEVDSCRWCGSEKIKAFGYTAAGIRRHRCNQCGKTFTPLSNTIFDSRKIPLTEWLDFLLSVFGYESFKMMSKANGNAHNTTRYWIQKVFIVLREYQAELILKDEIQLDETYYKVRSSDVQKRENGKEYRGISRNQICIGIASDGRNVIAFEEGLGKPSGKSTLDAFRDHIESGAVLKHDREQSHKVLAEALGLQSIEYNANEIKKLPDSENPLNLINRQCNLLKKFLNSHSGFIRDDLQDYLNLFCFISNPPADKHEKVEKLMILATRCRKTYRYREESAK